MSITNLTCGVADCLCTNCNKNCLCTNCNGGNCDCSISAGDSCGTESC